MLVKRLKSLAPMCAVLILLAFIAGCTQPNVKASEESSSMMAPSSMSTQMFSKDSLLHEVYGNDEPDYRVYTSQLLDVYFIACAIYFDFECPQILPNLHEDELYTQVKNYFMPYKNHRFIEELEGYVNLETRAQRDGVVYPLLLYAFSQINYGMDVDTVQSDVFQNAEEYNNFLESLYQFYLDTKAEEFFRSVKLQGAMVSYLNSELKQWPLEALFFNMESYVGNKNMLFHEKSIRYCSVMTLYRPFHASFYTIEIGNDIYLVGQQSPHDVNARSDQFDIDQTMNTTVHEFLHMFINQPVYEQNALILQLTEQREKSNYTGPMYQAMEWHRIVDEHIVRVVEAAIFADVMKDEKKAFDLVLKKEIQFGGMPKLQDMYDALASYEAQRNTYETIDSYLPTLILTMFS